LAAATTGAISSVKPTVSLHLLTPEGKRLHNNVFCLAFCSQVMFLRHRIIGSAFHHLQLARNCNSAIARIPKIRKSIGKSNPN
jgi:hypothetical protein